MVEPVTEQIIQAAVARLKTVDPANGYRTSFRRVLSDWLSLEEQNELPIALVIEAESEDQLYDELAGAGTLGMGETGELIKASIDFDVWYYAQGSDAVGASTMFRRLAADGEIALTKDLHLGLSPDVVWDVRKVRPRHREPVVTTGWHRFEGADLYRAQYHYLRGAP